MHVSAKLYESPSGTSHGLMLEIHVTGDDTCDEMIMDALKYTGRSYSPTVVWNQDRRSYHLDASWDVDPDWGDDYMAVIRRLEKVVPPELISLRIERPNEPLFEEKALVDIDLDT